ncbi:hypothetical protein SMI01S_11910 [Sphingobacterium mizutaii NBRC 14946 = DSM 11724]|uniref:Uncharacterized protein n=2 Tax=Sphingobacterium mizutaii TaxID=1010 RepID=A0AAJ4XC85_9SPHI|nr:hypothetical protein [Sphingobacterium mizutaii]GEM67585.1 hypothetical protein SMI01S_11910 [Sphingobacterium mizutaii NBRC 14946 = DSM 11724]SDL14715.1 hypothetical protein SAMN05192578_1011524 [Sphingobacterium mizutaii]SNV52206.1 Uncharacterised protein [Sphingobacterium mizutaii]
MQKTESKRNTLQIGSSIVTRGKGSKPLRKQGKKSQGFSPIVANGLYSLRLSPKLVCNQNKELEQLVPAYIRFVELFLIKPKDLNVLNPIKVMLEHINSIYAGTKMVDVIEDSVLNKMEYFFLYRTVYYESEQYNILLYKEIIDSLDGHDERYIQFLNCAIKMLLSKGCGIWQNYYEYCIEWMEDEAEQLMEYHGDAEGVQEEYNERVQDLDVLRSFYENGEAQSALLAIKDEVPDSHSDLRTLKESLDPKHPVSKFYLDVLEIYNLKESLYDFVDQFEDDFNPIFSFAEQFCIVYDLDDLFDYWEDYINNVANEGVGCPTSSTRITIEMDSIPVHNSKFPILMNQLFNKYSNFSKQIQDYGQNNRKAS